MSWGAYRVSAAVRAPARDAANRLRSWVIGKLRRYDTEMQDVCLRLTEEHRRAHSLERQLEIEKDRREGITQDLEREQFARRRLERDRAQFESQVRNRERNVAVKEQQLQRLEEQIQQAYNNGVRDGKYERAALQEQAATGDRAAARALHKLSYATVEDDKNGRGPTET